MSDQETIQFLQARLIERTEQSTHTAYRDAETIQRLHEELGHLKKLIQDPNAVRINMLRGTIAWTPETLRSVLGEPNQSERIAELEGEKARLLDALESMADQYLQIKDKQGRKRYDHEFMSAGEGCMDVLTELGRIPMWMDYRTGGEPPADQPLQSP